MIEGGRSNDEWAVGWADGTTDGRTDGRINRWTSGAPAQLDSVPVPLQRHLVSTGSAKCGRCGSLEIQITDVELLKSDLYRRIPYEHSG